ncbi:hypothetical protein BpHYR1_018064 [Brachionus plicatilis]|uniref:Uncharacterized protein n=1 Tax=Brachionus plicatilis TaxID=10195 RepID=A0A3M7P328_BRAPC|nr:hypothetical protein BpHYR1_018064 [Brachionus plicatilis]
MNTDQTCFISKNHKNLHNSSSPGLGLDLRLVNSKQTELGSVIKKSVFSQYQFFEHQFSISLS